ncbi:MAG: helicase [Gammaproteobacteria bacterium SG8_47]|nr:MAG: helicase [Gammaproteobacteria bacterium SG8_47]
MRSITDTLGLQGPLASRVPGFAPRTQQQELAEAVADALADKDSVLVAEAGTGTGKTFAYLVPALLSGLKIIISTGTKNLQDQLYHKDLPVVRDALEVPVSAALLKGRANYLCLHRLTLLEAEGRPGSAEAAQQLTAIRQWAGRTDSGDIAQLTGIAEGASIWPRVTSTADNCLGQDCSQFSECFVMKARRQAQAADVVVINHHLLLADMALREEGFADLLPRADAFIVDEAHQLPEVAGQFFGAALSSNQLLELARDARLEFLREIGEGDSVGRCADRLRKQVQDLRLAFGVDTRRGAWQSVAGSEAVQAAVKDLSAALAELRAVLSPLAERSKSLDSCLRRCDELTARFALLTETASEEFIHWFETYVRSFVLRLTPLHAAEQFQQYKSSLAAAWVFTSATLSVGERFDHFTGGLGLEGAETRRWESPFDFAEQALLYVPKGLPEPSHPGYTERVVAVSREVLGYSRGRGFVLFTSHRALQEAAERMRGELDYPILVQGEAPRDALLARFRELGNAVLLGTSSFWEGVDVRGDALSCVIIDKLPFASPSDPILQARIDAMRKHGENPFMNYQLPNAVLTLKQGVGRLIRDVSDRGVLVLCDPRLLSKPYGRLFLDSLPAMPRTRDLDDVRCFFAEFG